MAKSRELEDKRNKEGIRETRPYVLWQKMAKPGLYY
jgi:hypothetical protein